MNPTHTPIAVKNSGIDLEELLPQVLAAPPTQRRYLTVCRLYRRIAVGTLLMDGDPAPFFAGLFKSGRAFLYCLKKLPADQKLTSSSEPFFDAVACRDRAGALEIAQQSNPRFMAGKEYEEDFLYARFFMTHFLLGAPATDVARDLATFGTFAAQSDDDRHALCEALFEKDQQKFDDAIAACLRKIQGDLDKAHREDRLDPDAASTTAIVSTEVLAWLEFAEQAGLQVQRQYPFAPPLARMFGRIAYPPPDSWQVPESYRSFGP